MYQVLIRNSRKIVLLIVFVTFLISLLIFILSNVSVITNWSKDNNLNKSRWISDISDDPPNPHQRNIFFLETSNSSSKMGKLVLNARQACAVESAARMNPKMVVYVLFVSFPENIVYDINEADELVRLLWNYSNVKLVTVDLERYVQNSPVEILWKNAKISTSLYPVAHTSDILRLLTLWKYGGIYLDLDVINIKSLNNFPDNFAGAESESMLANGIMGFSHDGKGHEYLKKCLDDMANNFNGNAWGYNGPQLITRNIFKHCPTFEARMLIRFGRCEEFHVFPPSAFYLIPSSNWKWFFNEKFTHSLKVHLEEISYLVHFWNKLSYDERISKTNLNVPYLRLASKYCPGVIKELDEYF